MRGRAGPRRWPTGSALIPELSQRSAVCRNSWCRTTPRSVVKACLYERQINRTYAEMAADYDTATLPARPRRPRDKAKVEVTMLIIERWLGHLRHWRFYSLAELNT